MNKMLVFSSLALTLLPSVTLAAPPKKAAAGTTYQCKKCHMKMSAATAKKDHYKDPMDGGKLVPMKSASKPMGGMKM